VPPPPSPIGFDASVLINFCAVRRLELLVRAVPPPRYVLVDVLEELEEPACRRQVDAAVRRDELLPAALTPAELKWWSRYTLRLDPGESATLAAAMSRGWSVAVDERAARRTARQDLGPERLTGTVGVLRAAVAAGLASPEEGNELLGRMIVSGYRSPVGALGGSQRPSGPGPVSSPPLPIPELAHRDP
jgi:predicted nucleic acid-binding protein